MMAGRDVTAILMGDPTARDVRQPSHHDRERAECSERIEWRGRGPRDYGPKLSEMGKRVRAMKPGDTLIVGQYSIARGQAHQMRRLFGWRMRALTKGPREARYVELVRLT